MKRIFFLAITLTLTIILTGCAKKTVSPTVANSNATQATTDTGGGNRRADANTTGSGVTWMQTADGWQTNGTPPACPEPVLHTPTDLSVVTSILYPGQTRGGDYKPHGGFRFDTATSSNETVTAAMDGQVVEGSRYLVNGEMQYMFDIVASCGMMYRVGHLLALAPKFQAIAETFSPAVEGDSRTTNVYPPINVTAGEQIATAVGVTKGGLNVFFDFGVYNLQQKNAASQDATYAATHDVQLAQRAVCWLDLLPSGDAAKVKALPAADPTSGKKSDYCK